MSSIRKRIICVLTIFQSLAHYSNSCDTKFDGFGAYLGRTGDLNVVSEDVIQGVIDKLYFDLKLRHFRTSYEPYLSPSPGVYDISCNSPSNKTCIWSWTAMLATLSNRTRYPDPFTLIASIWSPPQYMKDPDLFQLLRSQERAYFYYLKNITQLIESKYGLRIEHISPVNEPENIFALWDHCNMNAHQLCSMVASFNDSQISLCPENSYFWVTQIFANYRFDAGSIDCRDACSIIATHAYALNINSSSPNAFKAYYDLLPYNASVLPNKTIWQTEVSSTYANAGDHQMEEGLDFATNIVHFVGHTCVERYYYWLAYNSDASGEALIWGHNPFYLPKKFYIYNHFTNASHETGSVRVNICTENDFINYEPDDQGEGAALCLKFDEIHTVFVNRGNSLQLINDSSVNCNCGLCCTTEQYDLSCDFNRYVLPPRSVCTCNGGNCI